MDSNVENVTTEFSEVEAAEAPKRKAAKPQIGGEQAQPQVPTRKVIKN